MKLKFYIFPLSLVILCFIIALCIRFSYNDEVNAIYDYNYRADDDIEFTFKENNINNLDDIIKISDIIIECEFTGERKITDIAFYSCVKVSKVFKGDKNLVGNNLNIFEETYIFPKNKHITSTGCRIPLYAGNRYILFLNKVNFDPQRKLNDFLQSQYYPVLDSVFSIYNLSAKEQKDCMDTNNNTYTINSLNGQNIFTNNKDDLKKYYDFKKQVLEMYYENKN